jgi:hypothetical protein
MPARSLTSGEVALLRTVFYETLPYDSQEIDTNDSNRGGVGNSITYSGTPYYSNTIWCPDFTAASTDAQWTFIHEFGHVWQSRYGTPPIIGFLANLYNFGITDGNQYAQYTYDYSLRASNDFNDYNIEQQASIIADYWAVSNSLAAQHCINPVPPQVSDYAGFISQVRNQGLLAPAPTPDQNAPPPGASGEGGAPPAGT